MMAATLTLTLGLVLLAVSLFFAWVALAALTDLLDPGADCLRQALGLVPGHGHKKED